MTQLQKFTIRPFPSRVARGDNKDAFRILLSGGALVGLKLSPGDPCNLHTDDGMVRAAIAWNAVERIQDNIAQTSTTLQELYKLKLGDKVSISKPDGPLPEIDTVSLEETKSVDYDGTAQNQTPSDADKPHWEWYLKFSLLKTAVLAPSMVINNIDPEGRKRSYTIRRIEGRTSVTTSSLYLFTQSSKVSLDLATHESQQIMPFATSFVLDTSGIGGLNDPITKLNKLLSKYSGDEKSSSLPQYYRPSRGVLLYGPKGTGKSLLIEKISQCSWRKVFNISTNSCLSGNEPSLLSTTFSQAVHHQPSLVVIEDIDAVWSKRNAADFPSVTFVSQLCTAFDTSKDAKVLVLAEARHPNDVEERLRAPGMFATEIETPVPAKSQRYDILKAIRGSCGEPDDNILRLASERTHGYVGADLDQLLQLAVEAADERFLSDHSTDGHGKAGDLFDEKRAAVSNAKTPTEPSTFYITIDDMERALKSIRPTAMREVFIDTPNVRWSDIGGQETSKRLLKEAVDEPLHRAAELARFDIKPKKGILLYGPTGCSKTLLVKALATESGLNILVVKGAELVDKYVGESERNIRDTFRKARAATPSILFFDEIDSIVSSRSHSGNAGGQVNLVTTFLNEMDGFEEMKNVLVVAATNLPESLDAALLRPGRFTDLIYVGLPSMEARKEIFEIYFRRSNVSAHVDATNLARLTEGYSGAEIVAICQRAGRSAIANADLSISSSQFLDAIQMTPRKISSETEREYQSWGAAMQRD